MLTVATISLLLTLIVTRFFAGRMWATGAMVALMTIAFVGLIDQAALDMWRG